MEIFPDTFYNSSFAEFPVVPCSLSVPPHLRKLFHVNIVRSVSGMTLLVLHTVTLVYVLNIVFNVSSKCLNVILNKVCNLENSSELGFW